ncbi:MAG: FadR family transcriptional regulator [Bryobacteraceae bacterium]|nr:FadR family transcriptional regulator [Bryobacteraceae bacterium]MDW8378843.1 FadR/GntR family transcriptional regulator [Bryobacterales bacterium]
MGLTAVCLSDKLILSLVYMIDGIKPLARRSLTDEIVDQLTSLIARGVLKPGTRMPSEKVLSEQFGVGRTSVREALRSLAAMGLIESQAGEGHFVSANVAAAVDRALQVGILLGGIRIEELIEARLLLEPEAAALAARRATDEQLAAIERQQNSMEQAGSDYGRYLEADLQFHLTIAAASQNSILANLLASIRGHLQSWIRQALSQGKRKRAESSLIEHRRILEAIRRKKERAARQAMSHHILSSSEEIQKVVRQAS